MKTFWLFKSEPGTYNFAQLKKDRKTNWNGIRNFQARNFLREAKVGDLALIYHSGDEKAVVGVAEVIKAAYPDPDPKKPGDWVQLDLGYVETCPTPVTLAMIKARSELKDMLLVKQSRLSSMPITPAEYKLLRKMAGF